MRTLLTPASLRIMLVVLAAQLLAACLPTDTIFTSGIAREWSSDTQISREQLIMEPLYYFDHLDKDLDRSAWILITQGKMLHANRLRQELDTIQQLLNAYITTLNGLPDGGRLPEYELASIYLGIFENYSAYLDNRLSMQEIDTELKGHETRIRQLEVALQDASERRLNILVQTLSLANET